jgi:signal transduction histidine kinase
LTKLVQHHSGHRTSSVDVVDLAAPIVSAAATLAMAGLALAALALADERPGLVAFALVAAVLATLRQLAAGRETRQLQRRIEHIEQAAEERHQLLTQLVERSASDRWRVAEQLHRQASATYVTFAVLLGTSRSEALVAQASVHVCEELERQARSLHQLLHAIRPVDSARHPAPRRMPPLNAYLPTTVRASFATIYRDRVAPRLDLVVSDELVLDWMAETVVLQIVQEALHNIRRHSNATDVGITIQLDDVVPVLVISDNGVGFEPAIARERAGISTMRAAAAVAEGRLTIRSSPGNGTTVVAFLGPDRPDGLALRIVPYLPDDVA